MTGPWEHPGRGRRIPWWESRVLDRDSDDFLFGIVACPPSLMDANYSHLWRKQKYLTDHSYANPNLRDELFIERRMV